MYAGTLERWLALGWHGFWYCRADGNGAVQILGKGNTMNTKDLERQLAELKAQLAQTKETKTTAGLAAINVDYKANGDLVITVPLKGCTGRPSEKGRTFASTGGLSQYGDYRVNLVVWRKG
jgi:hypothetical protein